MGPGSGVAANQPRSQHSRIMTISERANLHLVKMKNNILREAGSASGDLPGKVSGRFDVSNIFRPHGTVTFKPTSGGSITVAANGFTDSFGTNAAFHGTMTVKRGRVDTPE